MDKNGFYEKTAPIHEDGAQSCTYTRTEKGTLSPYRSDGSYWKQEFQRRFYENIENFLEDSRNSPNFVSLVQQGAANKGF